MVCTFLTEEAYVDIIGFHKGARLFLNLPGKKS